MITQQFHLTTFEARFPVGSRFTLLLRKIYLRKRVEWSALFFFVIKRIWDVGEESATFILIKKNNKPKYDKARKPQTRSSDIYLKFKLLGRGIIVSCIFEFSRLDFTRENMSV